MTESSIPFKPYFEDEHCTIYNGNCSQILPWLGPFDLMITDPPYGINAARHRKSQKDGWKDYGDVSDSKWDAERPKPWMLQMILGSAKDQIVWGGNYFADILPASQCWLLWDKGQRDFSLADAEMAWTSYDKAVRIFDYSRSKALQDGKVHPTQKPLALMQWCLGFSGAAKTIVDPFMGSGTTLVAAKLEGRKAVGIEINEKYCEAAVKRLEQGVLF